jgi:hypothetical protein
VVAEFVRQHPGKPLRRKFREQGDTGPQLVVSQIQTLPLQSRTTWDHEDLHAFLACDLEEAWPVA